MKTKTFTIPLNMLHKLEALPFSIFFPFSDSLTLLSVPILNKNAAEFGLGIKVTTIGKKINCSTLRSVPSNQLLHGLLMLDRSYLFMFGGYRTRGFWPQGARDAYALDLTLGEWRRLSKMEIPRHGAETIKINDHEILIAGKIGLRHFKKSSS